MDSLNTMPYMGVPPMFLPPPPVAANQAVAAPANATPPDGQARPSGRQASRQLTRLVGSLCAGLCSRPTKSRLGGSSRSNSLRRTLDNISHGKTEKLSLDNVSLVETVKKHEGMIFILGTSRLPEYAFEFVDGVWHGYSGRELTPMPAGSSPEHTLTAMMGQGQSFKKAYYLTGWQAQGDDADSATSMTGALPLVPSAASFDRRDGDGARGVASPAAGSSQAANPLVLGQGDHE